ncbi:hypothetical protein TNCV_661081 [Trichonephila clavipes]|nr:hypothetical protein TNCV_661081 [Trichonephila clavipes]
MPANFKDDKSNNSGNLENSFAKSKRKRWASGQLELEHPSFHDNDPNASGHASSNYENNAKVNTCTLNSSELTAATERKLSLLSHTSLEHLANEQDDTTYVYKPMEEFTVDCKVP